MGKYLFFLMLLVFLSGCTNPLGDSDGKNKTNIDPNFLNQGVQTENSSINIKKNSIETITLNYNSTNNFGTACEVSNLTNLNIVEECSCTDKICSVKVIGTSGFVGSAGLDFNITDNLGFKNKNAHMSIEVTAFNFSPELNNISDISTNAGTLVSQPISFTDSDNLLTCGNISASSNYQSLVLDSNITFSGTYPNCLINILPESNIRGVTSISVIVSDNDSLEPKAISKTFNLSIYNPPSPPQSLSLSVVSNQINLSWTPPSIGTAPFTYQVFRGTISGVYSLLTLTSSSSYIDTSAVAGVEYYYVVNAITDDGTSLNSNEVSGKLIGTFSITSVNTSSGQTVISWSPALGADSYNVLYGTSSGVYSSTLSNRTSPTTISSLNNGTIYFIKVVAINSTMNVESSEVLLKPLGVPIISSVAVSGVDSLTVTWSSTVGADSYNLYYGTSSGNHPTSSCTSSPCVINGISGTYYFRLDAANSVGSGASQSSLEILGKTLGSFSITSGTSTPINTSSGTADITWSPSVGATSYDVYYKTSVGGTYSLHSNTTNLSLTLPSVLSGSTYYFKVNAKNTSGTLESNEQSIYIQSFFSQSFDFNNSITYSAGNDAEISSGKGLLSVSNLKMEKTTNGSGSFGIQVFDNYVSKDNNLILTSDKIQMNSGLSGEYISMAMDGRNSVNSISKFSFQTSRPFGKEISLTAESGYQSSVTNFSTNLVALWRFNETVNYNGTVSEVIDATGTNHGKKYAGVISTVSDGRFNRSSYFNSIGENFIEVPDNISLDDSNKMTFSTWIYPTLVDGNPRAILSKRTGVGSQASYSIFLHTGNKIVVDIDGNNDRFSSNKTITPNKWYHIVVVFDGTKAQANRVQLYIDGALDKTSGELSTAIPNGSSSFWIGTLNTAYGYNYYGKIDETAIWKNRTLSGPEVAELYQRGGNRVKFQVRTCTSASAYDCSGSISPWFGKDGTSATYFTEESNSSDPINFLGSVTNNIFDKLFSLFGSGVSSWMSSFGSQRYVQYRTILESDSTTLFPDLYSVHFQPAARYALSSSVSNLSSSKISFIKINSISITHACGDANSNGIDDDVRYAFSFDGGSSYVAWNGTSWVAANSFSNSSTKSIAESLTSTEFDLVPSKNGNLFVQAFLSSNGSTSCEVDNIQVNGIH